MPKLVSGVLIPPAVASELADNRTPVIVRQWLSTSPLWLQIIAPLSVDRSLQLDRGEAEAFSLATERGIRAIFIDERKGFRIAKARGLEPIGMLAILEVSAMRGYIDFETAVSCLRKTTFHFSERLITDAVTRLKVAES